MFPVLFEIPFGSDTQFPIRMFGIMVILGFLAGTWVISKRLSKQKILPKQDSFDFCFYLLAMGILGSRLLYVMQNYAQFKGEGLSVFKIWEGGLVWYGGFALAAAFAFIWLAKRKLPILRVTDALALGLAIGLAVGRWGCFCAGDDYGKVIPVGEGETPPWYAVQFPTAAEGWRYAYSETPQQFRKPVWLHPAQIYMSLSNLVAFGLLMGISRTRAALRRPGVLTASYFMIYPIGRAVVELWRGDEDRGTDVMGTGLSFSQFFSIPIFLVGVLVLRYALKQPADDRVAESAE